MIELKDAYRELKDALDDYYKIVNMPYKKPHSSKVETEKLQAKELLYCRCHNILLSCPKLNKYIDTPGSVMSWQYLPSDAERVVEVLSKDI